MSVLAALASFQEAHPEMRRWIVAISGGPDSVALLHACVAQRGKRPLCAVHIAHGLHPEGVQWQQQVLALCTRLEVPLWVIPINVPRLRGASLEALAREQRYAALAKLLAPGDLLLTAHHADDQTETVFLQLLRGAGPKGLSAMPACKPLGAGWLGRPFLTCTRHEIATYLSDYDSPVVHDPSNDDQRFERNYWRHSILPRLAARQGNIHARIARSARLCAQEHALLQAYLSETYERCADLTRGVLSVSALLALSFPRYAGVMRFAFEQRGWAMPSERQLQILHSDVLLAAGDAMPLLRFKQGEIRRYRDDLYLLPRDSLACFAGHEYPLTGWGVFEIPAVGLLEWEPTTGVGLPAAHPVTECTLRFRRPGDTLWRHGQHQLLKHCWQAWGVPPWWRDRVPLICHHAQIIAVVGYHVCEAFAAKPGELSYNARWSGAPFID